MTLLDAIGSASAVAVSRLADEEVYSAIDEMDVALIEVPHVAGRPLEDTVDSGVTRVRHWPNLAGYLETGHDNDIVIWWPSLAPEPSARMVIPMGPRKKHTNERGAFLDKLMKRLERHRGVERVCRSAAARGIVYTPGVDPTHISQIAERYPNAVRATPTRLSEFPGGLCLSIMTEVWASPDAFADSVDALVARVLSKPARMLGVR